MDLKFSPEESDFRDQVRSFIREHLPTGIREKMRQGVPVTKEEQVAWQRILNSKGWAVPSWPVAYGGPGWSPIQRLIFSEEVTGAPAPMPLAFNVAMLGPVLIAFGSDAQKSFFLPKLANLDLWFCQGFSEPNAGSDLAALRTTARRDNDHFVVNGQKIWTTGAHIADWMFCLVRTDAAAKKQAGISFLLIDMRSSGITVRPITSIDHRHHLNEVFLDEVRVPVENLVGEEGKGWTYAKYLLGNERTGIAGIGRSIERLDYARELAGQTDNKGKASGGDLVIRQRIALIEAELRALQLTELRVTLGSVAKQGANVVALASLLKIRGSEISQSIAELLLTIGGAGALELRDAADDDKRADEARWASPLAPAYFHSRASSIYGGTNQIQRNILARTILRF